MQCIYKIQQKLKSSNLWLKNNRRLILNLIKYSLLTLIISLISFFVLCRLEINAHVYLKTWLSPPKPLVVEPLSSKCFQHNKSLQGEQKFNANFVPGLPVWEAHTCYDFAALFNPSRYPYDKGQTYHTYWSSHSSDPKLEKIQTATIQSFLATQNQNHTLIVWINKEDEVYFTHSDEWNSLRKDISKKDRIRYKVIEPYILTKGTSIESYVDMWISGIQKEKNDLLRMIVLYQYGGVWFDLDTLFVRDLSPLLEHEWIAQGSCFTGMFGNPFTGALFRFEEGSPYACEILEGATDLFKARLAKDKKGIPEQHLVQGADAFGAKLYYRVYRRILHHKIKPWSILPWCFTDPSQCKQSNSLPSLFSSRSKFDEKRVLQTFAYHWRDRWSSQPGSLFKFINSIYEKNKN